MPPAPQMVALAALAGAFCDLSFATFESAQNAANVLSTTELLSTGFNDANIGNGFLAYKVGDHCDDAQCTGTSPGPDSPPSSEPATIKGRSALGDGQKTLGGLHLAGVFNGLSNYTPSHRARLPSIHNVYVAAVAPTHRAEFVVQQLHIHDGVWYNRTLVRGVGNCSAIVEQRMYCHRTRRNIMVLEFQALPAMDTQETTPCPVSVLLRHREQANANGTVDVEFASLEQETTGVTTVSGATRIPELYGMAPTTLAMAYDTVPRSLSLAVDGGVRRFVAAAHSDLEGMTTAELAPAAAKTLAAAKASGDKLLAEHVEGWGTIWRSGIEVAGNVTVAKAVNASLYYIHSAVREDFPHGLSPGGLAIDSYDGRSFWDTETWMLPVLDIFDEGLGESLLRYRLDRLPAAIARAKQYGVDGATFPWTSTQTGYGTTHELMNSTCHGISECKGLGWQEQHINGDIAMAFRLHWRATGNLTFLRESWPLINATAAFWAARFVRQGGNGNWTILGVVGPDEPSGVQDSEVYTNAVAAQTILFAAHAATLLRLSQLPADWLTKAEAPYLPIARSLIDSNGSAVHPEYAAYSGGPSTCCNKDQSLKTSNCCIMQSAAALLQYPLNVPMPTDIKINDLKYYEPRTLSNGFFTGDSIYSIAWLALGETRAALSQWNSAFNHMDTRHFFLFREKLSGGHSNFITGAGGFLQNIVQGWAGVRIEADAMKISRPTLPPGVTSVKLRALQFRGVSFSLQYDKDDITFVAEGQHEVAQLMISAETVRSQKLTTTPVTISCVGAATFTIQQQ